MDNMTAEGRLDAEALERSVVSLELRQQNNMLRQTVDVLTQAHTKLGKDLTLKDTEIAPLESCCSVLKLEVSHLTEKVRVTEAKLHDTTVLYQNSQKSLLKAKDRLVQHEKETEEYKQLITDMKEGMEGLQQELQHGLRKEESRKMERKCQVKTLQKEVQNLKEIVRMHEGTVAEALAAKEENSKIASALQLQTEHLTSEKVNLEQQISDLEGKNSSLRNELKMMTDSSEHRHKLVTELQLRVDQIHANEQKLSDQLSSLSLLCEQKDEVILQLNSEKEELSHSLVALTQKAEADVVERTACMKRVGELEEQTSVIRDKMERLCAVNQALADELRKCGELQKCQRIQNVDAAAHKSEVEKDVRYTDCASVHNLCVESDSGNPAECQSLLINLQEMCEQAETEKPAYTSGMDITSKTEGVTGDDVSAVVQVRSSENELESDMSTDVTKVDSSEKSDEVMTGNVETQQNEQLESSVKEALERMNVSDNLPTSVAKVNSSEKSEKLLRPVVSENGETQQSEQLKSSMKEALERVNESNSLPTNVATDAFNACRNDQHNLNSAMGCANSRQVFDSHKTAIHVERVKDGSVSKESLSIEKVVCSNDTSVKLMAGVPVVAVADPVSKVHDLDTQRGGGWRVIKRFTRLPRSSCASKPDVKPCSSNVRSLHTQSAPHSLDVNAHVAADAAVKQLPDDKLLPVSEESAETTNEVSSADAESQDSTGDIPAPVPADSVPSSGSVCLANTATEATYSSTHSVCDQLRLPQAASECSQTANDNHNGNSSLSHSVTHSLDRLTGDGSLHPSDFTVTGHVPSSVSSEPHVDLQLVRPSTEPECINSENVVGSDDSCSDTKLGLSGPALCPSSKRLSVDVNADNAKKLRLG